MLTDAALGARFALRSGPLRAGALAACAMLGVTLLLFCVEFPEAAHVIRPESTRDDRLLLRILALTIAMPVAYLLAAVARLNSDARERRIAVLRLMGLSRVRMFRVVCAEVAVLVLTGGCLGVGMHALLRIPVYDVWEQVGFVRRVPALHPWNGLVIVVVVAVAAAVLTAQPVARTSGESLAAVRRGGRPAVQRTAAVLAAVGFFLTLVMAFLPTSTVASGAWPVQVVALGMLCLGVGLSSLTQTALRAITWVLRRRGSAGSVVMGARLEADRTAFGRALGGLVLSTFVVATGLCVFTAWKSTPQYVSTDWAAHHRTSTVVTPVGRSVQQAVRAPRPAGVESVAPTFAAHTKDGRSVVVLSCAQLAPFAQVRECSDDAPWVFDGVASPSPGQLRPGALEDGGRALRIVPRSVHPAKPLPRGGWGLGYLDAGGIVVPPHVAASMGLRSNALFVTLAPGERSDEGVELAGTYVLGGDWNNYAMVNRMEIFVFLLCCSVLLLGMLTVVVSTVDLIAVRRRRVASLQVLGLPATVLRRAQWGATSLPVILSVVIAVAAGMLCGRGYLNTGGYPQAMPWGQLGALLVVGLTAGVLLAAATGVGMGRPLTAEALRRE